MRRNIFLSLIIFLCIGCSVALANTNPNNKQLPQLLFFYSPSCHPCQLTKAEIMPQVSRDFSGVVTVEYLDVTDINNYQLMLAIKQKYNCSQPGVPTIFIEGRILVGYDNIKAGINQEIMSVLKSGTRQGFDKLPGIDVVKHFFSFGALTVATAGLIDGINPCAFTVIVFFISFLAFQGYRRKELVVIGLAFILAVFVTYILIGLGIFRWLYSLNKFYLVTKTLYYAIAVFSILLGIFALYDLWHFIRKKETEGMILQLPKTIKNCIHSVIGMYYRKAKGRDAVAEVPLMRLVISAFVTGFLVSLLEAVCTGQLYLPTITFVLREANLRFRAISLLLLYNFMFIVPLFIVFLSAIFGATSVEFSGFMKKNMVIVKLLMALAFFAMGIFILKGG